MPSKWPFDLDEARVGKTFALLVAWRPGRDDPGVGQINVTKEVGTFLGEACRATLAAIRERQPHDYSADMLLEDDECIVFDDSDVIDASPIGKAFLSATPELYGAPDLPARNLTMYAVVAGNGPGRCAYVRKTNPRKNARTGRLLTSLRNSLVKIDDPVFELDSQFDLVVKPGGVVAVSQPAFESLFRLLPEEAIPRWVKEISKHLPIAGKGAEALADRCISNSRLRRKLKAIVERGHLKKVTTQDIRQQLKILDLPEANFLDRDGHLVFDRARERDLLDLLNEDLIIGGLSKGRFRVDRKSLDTE